MYNSKPKFRPNTTQFDGGADSVKAGQSKPMCAPKSMLASGDRLLAENDEGCIEYKWKLTDITTQRLEHLMTQMKFRVSEGKGQCMYELGVADSGDARGLIEDDYKESIETVMKMAKRLEFNARVSCERVVSQCPLKKCCEILVTKGAKGETDDLSIAVCGSVDAGKSTFICVLSGGELDDGAGSARQGLFNHKHEVDSGRTSSLSQRVLGFDEMGRVTNFEGDGGLAHAHSATKTIADRSVRLVNLMDLAGDSRYAKTTIFGMTSRAPGYACIVLAADQPVDSVTQYFHLCHALRIPHFIAVTKTDGISDESQLGTILEKIAQQCNSVKLSERSHTCEFFVAENAEQAVSELCSTMDEPLHKVPVFPVSSVSGAGIDVVRTFLHQLPPQTPSTTEPAEVLLDGGSFIVPEVGTVVTGYVAKGTINVGSKMLLGPDKRGMFKETVVNSIHMSGCHVQIIQAGCEGAFAIGTDLPPDFDPSRKGGVMVASGHSPLICREFDAEVTVLTPDVIMPSQEPILHCNNIRQAVKIVSIQESKFLKRNQTGRIRCRLMYHPEMLDVGSVIVLRSNNTAKIVGKLISVYPLTPTPSMASTPSPAAMKPTSLDNFPSPNQSEGSETELTPDTTSRETSPTQRHPDTVLESATPQGKLTPVVDVR